MCCKQTGEQDDNIVFVYSVSEFLASLQLSRCIRILDHVSCPKSISHMFGAAVLLSP